MLEFIGLFLIGYFWYCIFNSIICCGIAFTLNLEDKILYDNDGYERTTLFVMIGLPILLYDLYDIIRKKRKEKKERNIPDKVKRMV